MRTSCFRYALAVPVVLSLGASCTLDFDRFEPSDTDSRCTPGETSPCYDADAATENVGMCTAGSATCLEDGSAFGPCEKQVTPVEEDCDTAGDDDCDGQINETDAGCSCTPGALVSCYPGPEKTEGVGHCVAGQKMCKPDGLSETVCFGHVVPRLEECGTIEDDDCDGQSNEGCPTWGARFGGTSYDWVYALHVQDDGGLIFAGEFISPSIDFGGGNIERKGDRDAFIVKLNDEGDHVFSKTLWNPKADGEVTINDIAVDQDGNIYAIGNFTTGELMPAPWNSPVLETLSEEAAFVVQFNSAGDLQWSKKFDGGPDATFSASGRAIAVYDQDTLIAAGSFEGTLDLGNAVGGSSSASSTASAGGAATGTGSGSTSGAGGSSSASSTASAGGSEGGLPDLTSENRDGWYAAMDMNQGSLDWVHQLEGPYHDAIEDVVVDGTSIILGGTIGGDAFVSKFNAPGYAAAMWTRNVVGSGNQKVGALALDGSDIVAFGDVNKFFKLDDFNEKEALPASPAEDTDVFVLKLASDGSTLFANHYVGPGRQECQYQNCDVFVDAAHQIWFGAAHYGSVDYGGQVIDALGNKEDWAIVALDASGNTVRAYRFGAKTDDDPRAIGADGQGNIYLAGDCDGPMDVGDNLILSPISSYSNDDICLVKLPGQLVP